MTEFNTEQVNAMYEAAKAILGNGHHPGEGGEWTLPTPLVDWAAAYGLDDDQAQWLAEPLLPTQGAVAIFAKGGTGKSLLALWIAAGLSTGRGFGELDPVDVLYLDYEMTVRDVVDRLEDMGYDDPAALKRLHYASLPTLAPLDTLDGGKAVVDMATHLGVALVVIDTFGRAVDGEEDRADTVRAWYRWTGQLLKTAGIGFLRIDHAGKDVKRGQRGTSAKNDDVDIVWEMTDRGHGEFLLRTTKRRVSWVPERVVLAQTDTNGILAYRWDDAPSAGYRPGALDLVALLDELGAPVTMSRREALVFLREQGHGRNNNVVADALRYRRERSDTTTQYHAVAPFTGSEVPDPGTATSPQVVPDGYHAVPPSGPNDLGGDTYVVRDPGRGLSAPRGLFDPDPEEEPDA